MRSPPNARERSPTLLARRALRRSGTSTATSTGPTIAAPTNGARRLIVLVASPRVGEHEYEVRCECGARWRVRLPAEDDDLMAACLACGADTFDLTDLGEVHSAGRDVDL